MAKLLDFLASGLPGAESGTVSFYLPSTLTPATVYKDADATSAWPVGSPIALGTSGQAVVFVTTQVRCVVVDFDGVQVFDQTCDMDRDRLVMVNVDGFEDVDGNTDLSLDTVLGTAVGSFRGTNFRYLVVDGETPLNVADVIDGIQIDVRAFGAVGNDAGDYLDNFTRALDYCSALGGGIVWVPRGIWRIRDTLVNSHANVSIRGVGRGASIIKCMGSSFGLTAAGDNQRYEDVTFASSVFYNAGQAITATATNQRFTRMDIGTSVGGWDEGIRLQDATRTVVDDVAIAHGQGAGISIDSGSGGGFIKIRGCTISGLSTGSSSAIRLGGAQQDIHINENTLIGSDYGVRMNSAFTGSLVRIRDNNISAVLKKIFYERTVNQDVEQSGNGLDFKFTTISANGDYVPHIIEDGLVHCIRITGTPNVTLRPPVPTPGASLASGENQRPTLRMIVRKDAGGSTYGRDSAFKSAGITGTEPYNAVEEYTYDPEQATWIGHFAPVGY